MADYHKKATDKHTETKYIIYDSLQKSFADAYHFITEEKDLIMGGKNRIPDITMLHKDTKRKLFLEIKTKGLQGNAHERAYLWFAPGVLEDARKLGNWSYQDPKETSYQYIHRPFLIIFTGECITQPSFRDEIKGHFGDCVENYILLNLSKPKYPHILEDHILKYFDGPLAFRCNNQKYASSDNSQNLLFSNN